MPLKARHRTAFQHIVAGLSWPNADKPGAIVILKTVWDPKDETKPYWFREVAHAEAAHLPTLFREAAILQFKWECDEWWGDALNEAVTAILYGNELGCNPVPLAPAPYIEHKDHSALYLQTLREMLDSGNVKLKFAKGSKLPDKVREYPIAETPAIEKYPTLAALCYAAAACHLWLQLNFVDQPKPWGQMIEERAENRIGGDEDALPWGGGAMEESLEILDGEGDVWQ